MFGYDDLQEFQKNIIPKELFNQYILQALADINYFTFDRLLKLNLNSEKNAHLKGKTINCAIELIKLYAEDKEDKTALKRESVGNYSVEYADNGNRSDAEMLLGKSEIIKKYFANTGLMYRGSVLNDYEQ